MPSPRLLFALFIAPSLATLAIAADAPDTSRGDRLLREYFQRQVMQLQKACLADIRNKEDWNQHRAEYRRQLQEMLGLEPWPEKTDLQATVTGKVQRDDFVVENVHFQSRPGLYVTGNLYLPKGLEKPAPAILYVCGHGRVKKNGISYGNKARYQHHGAWFARHGYVCLTIDTIQLGEIEGIHHGTYGIRRGGDWNYRWWWPARGYTSAGVEAWNGIRAIDYLQSRDEVDDDRIGVTGRSGGGAYSWWVAALDERVKAAVPVAGITDLENHVIDGTIEGHCDCMFMVNTYRWDFPQVAALVAPRALLISNSDKDGIFPLEGVVRVHAKTRDIYRYLGAADRLGLQITEGPHKDTQELRVHAFHWFNRFLKDDRSLIRQPAEPFFEPEELKVFDKLPEDERVTSVDEWFVQQAEKPKVPTSEEEFAGMQKQWMGQLRTKVFAGWPDKPEDLQLKEVARVARDGIDFAAYDFVSQSPYRLRLYLMHRAGLKRDELDLVVLNLLDEQGWQEWLAMAGTGFADQLQGESLPEADKEEFASHKKMFAAQKWAMAYVAPRGIGPTAWSTRDRKRVQIRRRFHLIGQSRDAMRVWDCRRAVAALRNAPGMAKIPLWLQSEREMAGVALYAALFEPDIVRLDLHALPKTHQDGPIFLNILKYMDLPQAVAVAAQHAKVRLYQQDDTGWDYPQSVLGALGTDEKHLQVRVLPPAQGE